MAINEWNGDAVLHVVENVVFFMLNSTSLTAEARVVKSRVK